MSKQKKIQSLIIAHLLKQGHLELLLPDGMILEVGVVAEDKHGNLEKRDNYCWVIASQRDRTISMDSYNLGLRYSDNDNFIFEDSVLDENGRCIKTLDVV